MKMQYFLLVSFMSIFWFYSGAHGDSDEKQGIIKEIQAMKIELNDLKRSIQNSVVATYKSCEDVGKGWVNYESGSGRFLLGSGDSYPTNSYGGLSALAVFQTKAFFSAYPEKERLARPNRPGFERYDLYMETMDKKRGGFGVITGNKGKHIGYHENMPPYLVVNFCIYQ